MQFVAIEAFGVTPGLQNGSREVTAGTPEEAAAGICGVPKDELSAAPWGDAPGVWFVSRPARPNPTRNVDVALLIVQR